MIHIASCEVRLNGTDGIRGATNSHFIDCVSRSNVGPGMLVATGAIADTVANPGTDPHFYGVQAFRPLVP